MNGMKSQKGQAIILIAFGIVALVGFTALAVDGGRVLSDRRHAQNAADTAVLAAALSKVNGNTTYKTQGFDRATSNGYTTGVNNRTVEVNLCNESGVTCDLPAGASASEYIRVKITSIVPMTFSRIVGRQSVTNVVEAIARVQGSTSTGFSFGNAGMVATKQSTSDTCFDVNGGAHLNIHGAGIFVNCKYSRSIIFNGNSDITLDGNAATAGCVLDQNGHVTYNNGSQQKCDQPVQDIGPSTFAGVPTLDQAPNCNSMPLITSMPQAVNHVITFEPGRYANMPNLNNDNVVLKPGDYCFSGDLNTNSGTTITGTGKIRIVMPGSVSMNLSGTNTFDNIEFYPTNGNLKIDGDLSANRLRFFASGTGNFQQQSASLISHDAYFYSQGGNFVINAQAYLDLWAPSGNDKYAGILFHKPWGNTVGFDLNGGTNSYLKGTILMPTAKVQLNGGSNMEVHGQFIASDFIINGSNKADIYYNPADNYNPPANPTIELTK